MMTFINGSCGLIVYKDICEIGTREELSSGRPFLGSNSISPIINDDDIPLGDVGLGDWGRLGCSYHIPRGRWEGYLDTHSKNLGPNVYWVLLGKAKGLGFISSVCLKDSLKSIGGLCFFESCYVCILSLENIFC